jgi:hypothetical protein
MNLAGSPITYARESRSGPKRPFEVTQVVHGRFSEPVVCTLLLQPRAATARTCRVPPTKNL